MSSSMIPSQNPEEHLDSASETNTPVDKKKIPTCTHTKHLFLMAAARVGHTSPLRLGATFPTTSLHNRRDFSLRWGVKKDIPLTWWKIWCRIFSLSLNTGC